MIVSRGLVSPDHRASFGLVLFGRYFVGAAGAKITSVSACPGWAMGVINPFVPNAELGLVGITTSGMMQMIHRVMQGEGNVDRAEQRAAQKENLSEATSDFFAKQRDRLKVTTSKPSASPAAIGTLQPLVVMPTSPSSALGANGLITPIAQPGPADTFVILAPAAPTK